MEFTQYTCPVCENRFENGDDVVVCPECGAPHHRECWEELGHCFYEERHGEGFSFEDASNGGEEDGEAGAETVVCQRCGAENEKTNFYCGTCGYGVNGNPMYDPMAGMNSEEEIAEGVKVGEAAKYIGKNTPYYLQVFMRMRQFGSGKFNFSAFLFTGAYFLYRKMYVPGVLLMLARIGIVVGSTALALSNSWMGTMQYSELMNGIYNNADDQRRTEPAALWAHGVQRTERQQALSHPLHESYPADQAGLQRRQSQQGAGSKGRREPADGDQLFCVVSRDL